MVGGDSANKRLCVSRLIVSLFWTAFFVGPISYLIVRKATIYTYVRTPAFACARCTWYRYVGTQAGSLAQRQNFNLILRSKIFGGPPP